MPEPEPLPPRRPDILERLRNWSLTGLYGALTLLMLLLPLATYSLWQTLLDGGNTAVLLWAFSGASLTSALLCGGATFRAARAMLRRDRYPGPAWIAIAMVAAVMVIAGTIFDRFQAGL